MKRKTEVRRPRLIVKGALILLLLLMNYGLFTVFFSSIVEDVTDDSASYQDARLQELAGAGEYADLYEELTLYDLYGEKYDDFWDVAEAWHLYCRYLAALGSAEADGQAAVFRGLLQDFPAGQENQTARAAVLRIRDMTEDVPQLQLQ